MIQTAIGGMNVSETVEGRERYPINLRYAREFRDDPTMLDRVLVPTPSGAQVPLSQVAEVKTVTGAPMVRSGFPTPRPRHSGKGGKTISSGCTG